VLILVDERDRPTRTDRTQHSYVARHINPTLLAPHIVAAILDEELQDGARLHALSMNTQAARSKPQIGPERVAFARCYPMSTMTSLEKLRPGTLHFDPALESIWISGAQAPDRRTSTSRAGSAAGKARRMRAFPFAAIRRRGYAMPAAAPVSAGRAENDPVRTGTRSRSRSSRLRRWWSTGR